MSLASSNNLVMKPPPLPPKKIIRSAAHMNLPINLNNFPPPSPTLSSPDRTFNGITAFEHYDPQSPKIEPKKHIHICKKHRAQNKDSEILVIEDNVDSNESNCLEQKSIPVTNPKMCKRLAKIKPMMKSDQNEVNDFAESNHADLKNRLISEIKNLNSGDKNVIFPDKSSLDQTSAYENIESKHLSKLTFSSNSDMSSSFCNGETQQVPSKAVRRNSFNGTQNEQPVTEKTKRKNSFNELKNVLKFGSGGGNSEKKKLKEKKAKMEKGKEKCEKASKDMVDSICKSNETSARKISFDSSPKIEFTFDMHVTSDIKNKITNKNKERKSELYEILKNKNNEMNEIISKENDLIASIKAKEQHQADEKRNLDVCNVNDSNNCDNKSDSNDEILISNKVASDTTDKDKSQQAGKGNVSPTKSVNFVNFVDTINPSSPKLSKANRNLRLKINNDIKPVSILKKNDGDGSKCTTPVSAEAPLVSPSSPLSIPTPPPLKPFERKPSFRANSNDLQEIKQKIDDSFQKQNLMLQNRLQNLQTLTSYSSLRKQRNASKTNLTRSHSDSNLSVASSYRNSLDLDEIFVIQDSDGNREDAQNGYFSKYFKVLSGSWKNLFTRYLMPLRFRSSVTSVKYKYWQLNS
ncbi:hypothetical protein M8J77_023906 [Diaphorina citri]|nr:hypothetical protein M8J77_023906 [Diaphorina citri]